MSRELGPYAAEDDQLRAELTEIVGAEELERHVYSVQSSPNAESRDIKSTPLAPVPTHAMG